MTSNSKLTGLVLISLLAAVSSGCIFFGSKKNVETSSPKTETVSPVQNNAAEKVEKKEQASGECTAEITANDAMQFSTKALSVKQGCGKITIKNIGKAPKVAMGHNLLVVNDGDYAALMTAAMKASKTEFIPASEKILAHSKLLGPGEQDTVDVSKLAAGTYTYFCSFPGHGSMMKCILTIR